MGTDLLSDIGREIDARLRELRPLVDEYEGLLQALGALSLDGQGSSAGSDGRGSAGETAVRFGGRRATKRRSPAARKAPARGKASAGGRASVGDQAREAIAGALEHGSHTVAELAVVTALSTAVINRSVRALVDAGTVRKTEREGKPAWALVAAE